MKFFHQMLILVFLTLSSCAFFHKLPQPVSYEEIVKISVLSAQTASSLAKKEALREEDQTVCLVSSLLMAQMEIPEELYTLPKENIVTFPELKIDVSSCQFSKTTHPTKKEVLQVMDAIVGPLVSSMSLYSGEISCREKEITLRFLEYLQASVSEITKEFHQPDGFLVLEENLVDVSFCS